MDKLVSQKPDDFTPAEEESGHHPTYAQLVPAHSANLSPELRIVIRFS